MVKINGVETGTIQKLNNLEVLNLNLTINGVAVNFAYCTCVDYRLENTDAFPPPPDPPPPPTDVNYDDCDGNTGQVISLQPEEIVDICACEDTISAPPNINISVNGNCCYTGTWSPC